MKNTLPLIGAATQLTRLALACAALGALGACGGGSDAGADIAAAPAPTPSANPMVTLTGTVVVNQAVKNAVVCLDLNANNACDTGEPAAAKTGMDGIYSLTYDNSQITTAQVAVASLIAPMVPGPGSDANTTVDAAEPEVGLTAKRYVLKQVPGKAGQINPLTTLVSAGIAAGMTETVARRNVAVQLAIEQSKIDNYQDDPVNSVPMLDNARTAAQITKDLMEQGGILQVGDQTAAIVASPGVLRLLNYTDAANYTLRTRPRIAKAEGTAGQSVTDLRVGKTAGADTSTSNLYTSAYLTSAGWVACVASMPITGTVGNPNRGNFCNGEVSLGHTVETSVSGRSMATVVAEQQLDTSANVINNGVATTGLLAALGGASFPASSAIARRFNLQLTRPIFINNIYTDARPASEATTLEQLIAAKPASAVVLSSASGTLSLGISSSNLRNLRFAFTGTTSSTAGTVQYYDCDLNAAQTAASNCTATTTGTYAISSINDTRVMRFTGHAPTIMNHIRLYVQTPNVPNPVFVARELKPDLSASITVQNRLNETAWLAMKGQLGI
jgi:hypothetical protein